MGKDPIALETAGLVIGFRSSWATRLSMAGKVSGIPLLELLERIILGSRKICKKFLRFVDRYIGHFQRSKT